MKTREQNLAEILQQFREMGMEFKLINGVFMVNKTTCPEPYLGWIAFARDSLSVALRRETGRCLECGLRPAVRPRHVSVYCETCYVAITTPIRERLERSAAAERRVQKAASAADRAKTSALREPDQAEMEMD